MRRPWILTPRGQRTSAIFASALSLILIPLAAAQISGELSRVPTPLDSKTIDYCEVSSCSMVAKLPGIEVVGIEQIIEGEFGILIEIRLINHAQLVGEREIWAELRGEDNGRIESMRGVVSLSPKGRQLLELFFTGSLDELETGTLLLGF